MHHLVLASARARQILQSIPTDASMCEPLIAPGVLDLTYCIREDLPICEHLLARFGTVLVWMLHSFDRSAWHE
jgi:hypothetical protein